MTAYFWSPLLRRERPPGTSEYTIGIVLVPFGGPPGIRVLPGNDDLRWAVDWIREELGERGPEPEALAAWWRGRAAFTEDPVRLGVPAPGVAEDADAELDLLFDQLSRRSPWATRA